MTKTIENLFLFINLSADILLHLSADVLIILLFFLSFKRNIKERVLTLIAIYILLDFVLNATSEIFSKKLYTYVWSTFTFIEYSVFTYVLWSNIKNTFFRKLIIIASILFVIFTTVFNIATNFRSIDSIPIGIETILILIFSFYYLYEQMNDTNNLFVYNKYQFWIVIGFMIYLAGSFFVFLFASRIGKTLLNQYWFLTNCFYVLMGVLFIVGFVIHSKGSGKAIPNNYRPSLN